MWLFSCRIVQCVQHDIDFKNSTTARHLIYVNLCYFARLRGGVQCHAILHVAECRNTIRPIAILSLYPDQLARSVHTCSGVPRRGLGGLEPLPLAYDLRNKRVRKRQNMVFSTKNTKHFLGKRAQPPSQTLLQWRGDTPSPPFGACGISTPPILKSWVRHCLHR